MDYCSGGDRRGVCIGALAHILGELFSMNNNEVDNSLPLGLDVGTSRIVVARNRDKKYQYDAQLNAFITLPYSNLAQSLLAVSYTHLTLPTILRV